MGKIHVLDKHTAELIAAGEVVERPSSVIKELLENTIDAGADTVTVEIQNGGITMMRITDNGCGIAHEDVPTAFLRHATSKVRTEEDLEQIGTLGFRGEALASIAVVADVKLITCTPDSNTGTLYHIAGGEELAYEEIGAPQGTTITVSNLFYNVPARMKFLKKDVSEGNAVAGVVQRLALSHPEISVRFIRDGKQELITPGDGDLYACIYAVLGRDFAANMLAVDHTSDGVHVHGYVCKPSATRANRTMQHFFINGRYVKTNTAAVALERAYHSMIMTGRFPAGVLHLDIAPTAVDVNVHPAKIEVRFINEKPVFDAVYHGVRAALQNQDTLQSAVLPRGVKHENIFERKDMAPQPTVVQPHFWEAPVTPKAMADTPKPTETVKPIYTRPVDTYDMPTVQLQDSTNHAETSVVEKIPAQELSADVSETVIEETPKRTPVRIIGELFSTYILAEQDDELIVVDKHAAHERILYNELKKAPNGDSQMLLEPVAVTLNDDAYNALFSAMPMLEKAGYILEEFGGLTVLVRAIPTVLSGTNVTAAIEEIAGGLAMGKRDITTVKEEWLYHSIACRAAIKAGDNTTPAEYAMLVERVLHDKNVRYCPHGRPVCFILTKAELEKQFGRTQ